MTCPKCNMPVPEGARFCPECQTELKNEQPVETIEENEDREIKEKIVALKNVSVKKLNIEKYWSYAGKMQLNTGIISVFHLLNNLKARRKETGVIIGPTIFYAVLHAAGFVLLYTLAHVHIAWLVVWSGIALAAIFTWFFLGAGGDKFMRSLVTWVLGVMVFGLMAAIFGIASVEIFKVLKIIIMAVSVAVILFVYFCILAKLFDW